MVRSRDHDLRPRANERERVLLTPRNYNHTRLNCTCSLTAHKKISLALLAAKLDSAQKAISQNRDISIYVFVFLCVCVCVVHWFASQSLVFIGMGANVKVKYEIKEKRHA